MKNLPKEKRDRMLLTLIGGIAVIAGLWFGVVRAQKESLTSHAALIESADKKVRDGQRRVSMTAQTEAELAEARSRLEEIENGMAPADKYFWLIQTVNQFRGPFQIEKLTFGREQVGDIQVLPEFPYQAATFAVQGVGYYHELGKFVSAFENRFPYISLRNLLVERQQFDLTSITNVMDREKLSFKMDIVALIKPVPKE